MLINEVACYVDLLSFNVIHYVNLPTYQFTVDSAIIKSQVLFILDPTDI